MYLVFLTLQDNLLLWVKKLFCTIHKESTLNATGFFNNYNHVQISVSLNLTQPLFNFVGR